MNFSGFGLLPFVDKLLKLQESIISNATLTTTINEVRRLPKHDKDTDDTSSNHLVIIAGQWLHNPPGNIE
ncbi:MAG: hypothetical protein EX330_02915 [Candidatus Brocadia sp. BROELEC01]|nr:hypothetical protein [Candidatus Brocadia sapporoensis]QQR66616.1 MAG: hypothetical protein IPI25_14105 [Candidatus Brocadia sp.]RZV59415.1 MAG: hypothetical protein EX330_02915 [Candidatus Brocadia sp. BROELEC01]